MCISAAEAEILDEIPAQALPLGALFDRAGEGDPFAVDSIRELERQMRLAAGARFPEKLRRFLEPADVVQEVWLGMLRQRRKRPEKFGAIRSPRAVLLQAVKRKTWEEYRSRSVCAKRDMERQEPLVSMPNGVYLERHFVAAGASPVDAVLADDLFTAMLGKCEPAQAEVLKLRREGFTQAEIAERMGLNERTVRRYLDAIQEKARAFAP